MVVLAVRIPSLEGWIRVVDDIAYLSSQGILETPLPLRHADDGNSPEIGLSGTLEVHFIEKYFAGCMRRVAVGKVMGKAQARSGRKIRYHCHRGVIPQASLYP